MNEQDGIQLPWQPESHKPALPFVICTDGEENYWASTYDNEAKLWMNCSPQGPYYYNLYLDPIAWIEPEKFVPFLKKRELHRCLGFADLVCEEEISVSGQSNLWLRHQESRCVLDKAIVCPFCAYKPGEK